jgi:hypothetical protein
VSDQEIQSTRSGSSELVGQGIKLLQSGLIPFPKEQVDISLISLRKSLHRDVTGGDISIYSV